MIAPAILIAGAVAILTASLSGQTGPAPRFLFLHENKDAPKDKHVLADLKKWTVLPSSARGRIKSLFLGQAC